MEELSHLASWRTVTEMKREGKNSRDRARDEGEREWGNEIDGRFEHCSKKHVCNAPYQVTLRNDYLNLLPVIVSVCVHSFVSVVGFMRIHYITLPEISSFRVS